MDEAMREGLIVDVRRVLPKLGIWRETATAARIARFLGAWEGR